MNQGITDASDFGRTAIPQLTQLDALLRCHICKDFLRVPVLTPCGHTFCSLCIREYLRKEPKCPLCLNELRESNLRSEFLVNEVIESYKSLRQPLLNFLNSNTPPTADTALIELVSQSDDDDDIQILATTEKRRPKGSLLESATLANRVAKDSTKIHSLLKIRNERNKSKEKMVPCPICQNLYPMQALERTHLDECLTLQTLGKKRSKPEHSTANQNSLSPRISDISAQKLRQLEHSNQQISHLDRYLSSSNNVDRQRLPKINFTSMSANQIKQKLASLGLPTNGTKQNMMARYNQYEMLWNSNFCDSLEPVSENELKRQLTSWEASHNNSNAPSSNNYTISTMMKRAKNNNSYQKLLMDFKTDKFERRSWISMFEKEFRTLIQEARRKMVKGPHGQENAERSNVQEEISKADS